MEGTLSATSTRLLSISKTLCRSTASGQTFRYQLPLFRSRRITTTTNAVFQRSSAKLCSRSPLFDSRTAGAAASHVWCHLQCVSSSAASFASSSGADGGEVKASPIVGGADDVSPSSSDVIILDVKGMTCGGCASSVKRILENQAQVSSTNVDLTTETAIVWPMSEAKVTPDWQKVIGEELAKNLTNCGFTSNHRGEAATKGEPF